VVTQVMPFRVARTGVLTDANLVALVVRVILPAAPTV